MPPPFEVPQSQDRLFLARRPPGPAALPCASRASNRAAPTHELPAGPTVLDAIGDLPEVELCPQLASRDSTAGVAGFPKSAVDFLESRLDGDDEE